MSADGFPFKSLGAWIAFLENQGDIVHNKQEVSIWGDIAAISRKIAGSDGPAVIHENIGGYPGWRMLTDGLTARRRQLWALNLPPMGYLPVAIERTTGKPAKPVKVDSGPCKEVKLFGDDIDLVKFPTPFTGDMQPAPHFTAGFNSVRDPETGWVNSGVRRFQVAGKNKLLTLILPYQHDGIIFAKYMKMGKPMPISISLGVDPITNIAVMMPAPPQFDELDYWGMFVGEPLEVVASETNDILVPATAEIVIEGEIDPFEREVEGPFPEFPGYYSALRWTPAVKVKAVTMRPDALYHYMYMGVPPSEGHNAGALLYEIELYRQIKPLVPEVTDVGVLSTWSLTIAVALNKKLRRPGLDRKVAAAVKAIDAGRMVKHAFIVDDYVDVRNVHDVLWSFSVKFQPQTDIVLIPETMGILIDPSETVIGPGTGYSGLSSFAAFICLEKLPPYDEGFKRGLALPPEEALKRVGENWTKYGFK
jgi:UbiD family decarboxylase